MKKRTKLTFAGIVTVGAAILLSGCTASFCSKDDKAHILYAFDYGVTDYYDGPVKKKNAETGIEEVVSKPVFEGNDNLHYLIQVPTSTSSGLGKTNSDAAKTYIGVPTNTYFLEMDKLVLKAALRADKGDSVDFTTVTYTDALNALDKYGYLKFAGEGDNKLWSNWDLLNQDLRDMAEDPSSGIALDDLPTNDWLKLYKKDMNSLTTSYRSCIAISEDKYGYYGYAKGAQYRNDNPILADNGKIEVTIQAKDWGYAWKKGFLEGLLVFPIAWLTETFVSGFKSAGVVGGLAQLLAIFAITFIVRALMLLVTFKQTSSNAKMQAIQPEITKIQNKYPNANKNTYEKQQMAAEMNKLYKKNKINPLGSLLVMIVQFPVFICVWGALQGCASLSTDAFLNLHLSDSISGVLFGSGNWANGSAVTALILFLLMSGAQVIAMLLPQWIQKKKRKQVASLGKNPAQNDQQSKMKMFTYIMMAMIIFMGFTLPSAMGVYWFVGALFSVVQTLVFEKINSAKAKKKGR